MCGVAGIVAYKSHDHGIDPGDLEAISRAMTKRGPDGEGSWFSADGKVALAHRRLAVIGLGEQGTQPMVLNHPCRTAGGEIAISYNGEIYNYRQLRHELEGSGHRFVSETDTEVLLHLYEERGIDMVRSLRGMFAFILSDIGKRETHLVRDPFGIKPLYMSDDGKTVRVASQAKALLSSSAISKATDDAALAGLLVFGNIPEPLTAWSAIKSVPAGSIISVGHNGARTSRRFFSPGEAIGLAEQILINEKPDDVVRSAVLDSVRAHLVSDVEVGVFLSSGIDSSAIMGLAAEIQPSLHAVTIGFREFAGTPNDEVPLARTVASTYGARHSVEVVSENEVAAWLPAIISDMDQPTVDGLNTWLVSKAAREQGLKVAISGLGGDEFLGGYPSFNTVPSWSRWLRGPSRIPGAGWISRKLLFPFLRGRNPKAASLLEYGESLESLWLLKRCIQPPWAVSAILGQERANAALTGLGLSAILTEAAEGTTTPYGAIAALESTLYMRNQLLRDADWAGMAHSLEIRVPLVDIETSPKLAAHLTQTWTPPEGKLSLARAPRPPVPSGIASRTKTGFTLPMAHIVNSSSDFGDWRRIPWLRDERSSWSQRWSFQIAAEFGMV